MDDVEDDRRRENHARNPVIRHPGEAHADPRKKCRDEQTGEVFVGELCVRGEVFGRQNDDAGCESVAEYV